MVSKLEELIKLVEKKYGKGTLFQLGEQVGQPVPCIPTGITSLDKDVLGIGGFPKGRIIEMYGETGGGKSTMLLTIIASAQKLEPDKECGIIDAEHSFSADWAHKNGVNVDKLFISQPDSGEQSLDITEDLINSEQFSVIGVDSVAALVPQAELDGEISDQNIGLQARLMSKACRRLRNIVNNTQTLLVFTNQLRQNIGITFQQGPQHVTTGGKALKFYASVRLEITRIGAVKDGDEIIGNQVKIKAVKNKLAPPFKEAVIELKFDSGFDKANDLLEHLVANGKVDKSGAWYSYKDERMGQGKLQAREYIIERFDEMIKLL
jgi:recombination protein RecA